MGVADRLRKLADLYERKARDYAPNENRPWENFEFSATFAARAGRHLTMEDPRRSTLVLLGVKISRMMTVGIGGEATNETSLDTVEDLATYAMILREQCNER